MKRKLSDMTPERRQRKLLQIKFLVTLFKRCGDIVLRIPAEENGNQAEENGNQAE